MIYQEIHEMNYSIFLANEELEQSLFANKMMQESYGLVVVQEAVKDTIIKYLGRIATAITKVWKRLLETIGTTADQVYLKSIQNSIQNANPKFTINNFPNYDLNKLNQIQVVQLDYEAMKESLQNEDDFIKQHYSQLDLNKYSNLKDAISNYCINGRGDTSCTGDMLKSMYNYCLNDYKKQVSSIQDDLKKYNNSSKNITDMVNKIVPNNSPTTSSGETNANESFFGFNILNFVLEDNTNQTSQTTNNQNSNKISFQNDDNSNQEKKNTGSNEMVSVVKNYVKATTEILSAKMAVTKDVYSLYMQIIKHYAGSSKTEKSENNTNNNQPEENTSNINTQVSI